MHWGGHAPWAGQSRSGVSPPPVHTCTYTLCACVRARACWAPRPRLPAHSLHPTNVLCPECGASRCVAVGVGVCAQLGCTAQVRCKVLQLTPVCQNLTFPWPFRAILGPPGPWQRRAAAGGSGVSGGGRRGVVRRAAADGWVVWWGVQFWCAPPHPPPPTPVRNLLVPGSNRAILAPV